MLPTTEEEALALAGLMKYYKKSHVAILAGIGSNVNGVYAIVIAAENETPYGDILDSFAGKYEPLGDGLDK